MRDSNLELRNLHDSVGNKLFIMNREISVKFVNVMGEYTI